MTDTKETIEKLKGIQELWVAVGRTKRSSPQYETLMKKIRVLSAEYQDLVEASPKPPKPK